MAAVSGQLKDAGINGKPRDLMDIVFNIAPTDTPFLSMCGRADASQTLHEWQTETLAGNVARPTWTAPEVSDMSSSMTAVVKVDLKAQYLETAADFVLDNNDLLAAFSGETCLGTAQPQEGLFFLYIAAPVTGNPSSVTLRYYSAHYKTDLRTTAQVLSFPKQTHAYHSEGLFFCAMLLQATITPVVRSPRQGFGR